MSAIGVISPFSDLYNKLNLAVSSSVTDVFLVAGIAGINYGRGIIKASLLPNVPAGMARNLADAGFDAAADISKFILYDLSIKHAAT